MIYGHLNLCHIQDLVQFFLCSRSFFKYWFNLCIKQFNNNGFGSFFLNKLWLFIYTRTFGAQSQTFQSIATNLMNNYHMGPLLNKNSQGNEYILYVGFISSLHYGPSLGKKVFPSIHNSDFMFLNIPNSQVCYKLVGCCLSNEMQLDATTKYTIVLTFIW